MIAHPAALRSPELKVPAASEAGRFEITQTVLKCITVGLKMYTESGQCLKEKNRPLQFGLIIRLFPTHQSGECKLTRSKVSIVVGSQPFLFKS